MKITSVELIPFDQPYKGNLVFSANSVKAVGAFVLVRINTDEGYFGIGSSVGFSPSPNMNKGLSREGCMVLLKDLSSLLIGEDPLRTGYLMDKVEQAIGGWYGENWWVLSYLDGALYDLKGKILNVPVYDLLGGKYRDRIPLEHIQSFQPTAEAQADEAKRYVDAGFKSIKLHVDAAPGMAVKRMKAVREAVGPDIPIGVDMGCNFRAHDALRVIEAMDEYNLNFVEQALAAYDYDGMVALRQKTRVPMVADTSALSVNEAYNLVKLKAVDSCHALICRIGGLRRAAKWMDLMDTAFIDYQICHLGNSVANAAAAHLAVTRKQNARFNDELAIYLYLHGTTDTKSIKDDIVFEANGRIEDGYLYAPETRPGLGIELNAELLKRYQAHDMCPIVVK